MARPINTQLFQLVQRLTKAERIYIHKALARPLGRGAGAMLELYELVVLAADKGIAAADIAPGRGERTASSASQLKRSLYDAILRHLRTLAAERSTRSAVLGMLEDITILDERALPEAAIDRAQQALQISSEAFFYALEAEILVPAIAMEKRSQRIRKDDTVTRMLHRQRQALENALVVNELSILARRIRLMQIGSTTWTSDDVRGILAAPVLADGAPPESARARMWYHHVRIYAHHLLDDNRAVVVELETLIALVHRHRGLADEAHLMTLYANQAAALMELGDAAAMRRTVDALMAVDVRNDSGREELWFNVVWLAQAVLLLERDYTGVLAMAVHILQEPPPYPTYAESVHAHALLMKATAQRMLHDPSGALRTVQNVLNLEQPEAELKGIARILEVMCLLDDGASGIVPYKMRSLNRSLPAAVRRGDFWKAFSEYVRQRRQPQRYTAEQALQAFHARLATARMGQEERVVLRAICLDVPVQPG